MISNKIKYHNINIRLMSSCTSQIDKVEDKVEDKVDPKIPKNGAKSKTEQLGDDMKAYEVEYEVQIPGDHAFIVRADGHSFSKFTRGFHQPFDENFKTAMIRATGDAINQFHASTGYTHSDEITLIFPPMPTLNGKIQQHPFNGRVCKLLTLISSYISVRFNYHILELVRREYYHEPEAFPSLPVSDIYRKPLATNNAVIKTVPYTEEFIEKIESMQASFDARILDFPPGKFVDIARHMIWRSLRDCSRNAISTYARIFFSPKQVHNKNSTELIEMMKTLKNFDYDSEVSENEKIGTYLKKELFQIESVNPQSKEMEKATRSRVVSKTMKANTSAGFVELLLAKYF